MPVVGKGPEIDKSALIIVDMQNDFLHRDGSFSHIAREHPECQDRRAVSNRNRMRSGQPEDRSLYLAHVLKPDYSDAAFPYWRVGIEPAARIVWRGRGEPRSSTT